MIWICESLCFCNGFFFFHNPNILAPFPSVTAWLLSFLSPCCCNRPGSEEESRLCGNQRNSSTATTDSKMHCGIIEIVLNGKTKRQKKKQNKTPPTIKQKTPRQEMERNVSVWKTERCKKVRRRKKVKSKVEKHE